MDSNPKAPTLVSLSATQRTPSPPLEVSSSPGNSSLRIRALLSPDSDTEIAIKHKSDSSSDSSSCSSSSDSEEESMGLVVNGEEAMGSSDLPSPMPKAQLSGNFDDNEVLGSDEEDDGFSGVVVRIPSVVEAPKVRVLGDEEGEQGVSSGLNGELGIASNGSELIGDDKLIERPVFVLNPGNREMGSEGKRYGLEQIAVSVARECGIVKPNQNEDEVVVEAEAFRNCSDEVRKMEMVRKMCVMVRSSSAADKSELVEYLKRNDEVIVNFLILDDKFTSLVMDVIALFEEMLMENIME